MILEKERKDVIKFSNKLIEKGLTKGTGGNVSILNQEKNLVAISPSGIEYHLMEPKDVVVVDLDGKVIDGYYKPSSEISMHLIFYNKRNDLSAIVHTHSTFAKTIATLRMDLPAVSYLVAHAGIDVKCAAYASFGTEELAENAFNSMRDRKATLLANHGLLTGAADIENAFNIAEEIEFCCEVYYRSLSIGKPFILDDAEMEHMLEKFKTYGQIKES